MIDLSTAGFSYATVEKIVASFFHLFRYLSHNLISLHLNIKLNPVSLLTSRLFKLDSHLFTIISDFRWT